MFGIGIERVMLTELAAETLSDANIYIALFRHSNMDWGDVSEEDKKANDAALKIASTFSCENVANSACAFLTRATISSTFFSLISVTK